jgi:hypothetical protein
MARPSKSASGALSRRVLVNIKRDQTTATPRVVWAHEVPILEAIWGEGNVQSVEPETLDEGFSPKAAASMLVHNRVQDAFRRPSQSLGLGWVFCEDARTEYDRLASCYGMHPEVKQTWVENVFGRFQGGGFQTMVARPELEDLPEDQLRAMLLQSGYQLPIVTYESSEAERAAATKARKEFESADKAALVKLADEYGVELG